jgi:hypothetical protein
LIANHFKTHWCRTIVGRGRFGKDERARGKVAFEMPSDSGSFLISKTGQNDMKT